MYNIGGGERAPLGRCLEVISSALGAALRTKEGPRAKGDVADTHADISRAREDFGYSPKDVSIQLVKTNPYRLSDVIENYDEVADYLTNTPYHWMINS